MNVKIKSWINAILLLITLIVNGAGAFGLINNLSQKEVSDMYPTLITPSPSTFSIWSVIYTFLIISIVVMIIKNNNSYYERAINEISFLFWLSCALNIVWIVSFSYNLIGLSTIFIFAFLIIMVLVTKRIGKIQSQKRWLLPLTFALYSGWLFIATVVNIAAWLVKIEWGRFGIAAEIWSVAILLVAVVLTALILLNTKNAIFPIPIAWAYFGIYNVQLTTNGNTLLLKSVSLIGIVLLVGVSAIQFYKNQYHIIPVVQ
jgi:benzodiazapine receptor